jgi:hypothetical protein
MLYYVIVFTYSLLQLAEVSSIWYNKRNYNYNVITLLKLQQGEFITVSKAVDIRKISFYSFID